MHMSYCRQVTPDCAACSGLSQLSGEKYQLILRCRSWVEVQTLTEVPINRGSCPVGFCCARCYTLLKILLSLPLQVGDVQSGRSVTSSCRIGAGMSVGASCAEGAACRNTCMRLREIASANVFSSPGMCSAHSTISHSATKKYRLLSKCITSGCLLVLALNTCTTAMFRE